MIRVAITGATGFIGRRLLTHLATDAAITVRVHSRRAIATTTLPAQLEQLGGDLCSAETWHSLLRDVDAVVHIAGAVRGRNAEDFAINHRAVAALVEAANALAAPPRVLLFSSLAARRPELSDYAASKFQGEREFTRLRTAETCVIRPPAVYGPGDVEMLPLLRAMAAGLGAYPGDLAARVSLLHIDDLCRLVLAWLRNPGSGETLEPDDGRADGYSWRELHAIVAATAKRRVIAVRLPPGLLHGVASLLAGVARLGGPVPMLSHGKVRELTATEWVCTPMPTRVGDWQPRINLATGLGALLSSTANEQILA